MMCRAAETYAMVWQKQAVKMSKVIAPWCRKEDRIHDEN